MKLYFKGLSVLMAMRFWQGYDPQKDFWLSYFVEEMLIISSPNLTF